jgi:hypothetical protein
MSAFIGPIHYWLYDKIRLVSQREEYIYQKAYVRCGMAAEELREQVWQTYGEPLPEADLGDLLDHNNIHGWLQRQINVAESREAAFVKGVLETCGDGAEDMIEQAFSEHGKLAGEDAKAKDKYELTGAPGIYNALNDYYLSGMPCDQGDMVVSSEEDRIVWEAGACLQEPNWKRADVDSKVMLKFYQAWLKEFVGGANPAFLFRQVADKSAGDPVNRFEIYRGQC